MHIETKKIHYDKDKDKDVMLVNLKNMEYKDFLSFKINYLMYNYYGTKKNDTNGNIRIFNLADRKKYVCIDADDKKSNDHVSYVMKKYGIKDNCYPSISNYFYHDYEENAHKNHYWFETDMPITSHINVNHTKLDVWGPKGEYTRDPWVKKKNKKNNIDSDNDSPRLIYEPNVEGMYLDTSKKYPLLTNKIYHDIMNINLNTSIFSSNKKTPSCMFHDDCINFELFKYEESKGFKRDGYYPISESDRKELQNYLNKDLNSYVQIVNDKSFGVICCVKTTHSNNPFVVAVRTKESPKYLSLPKGHPLKDESEISCALRELREETSIDASNYIDSKIYVSEKYTFVNPMHSDEWKMHKNYPDESKRPFYLYYKEVKYFLAVFPETIELKPKPNEILECKWIPLSEFKKKTYPNTSKILTEFFNSNKVKSKVLMSLASNSVPENKKNISLSSLFQSILKKKSIEPNKIQKQNSTEFTVNKNNSKSTELIKNQESSIFKLPFNKKKTSGLPSTEPITVKNKGLFNFFKNNK